MKDAAALIAEARNFGETVNRGRDSYTGGPKPFHHMGHKREAAWPWLSDHQIGDMVRGLLRTDIGHEAVVCAARDRIFHLSEENARMRAALAKLADAADGVGVRFFDTDTMEPEVEEMQQATQAARTALLGGA